MEAGCDVVCGCPHLDPDPPGASAEAFGLAVRLGRPIDLHTDETLNPAARGLCDLVGSVAASDFSHGAVASHCVSLGVQDPERQAQVARAVAVTGVAIVTLPQTNLYLQARGLGTSPPRGLTAVRALRDAGACVAAGADNVRDPFNCVGRSDPLETAALLVMAAHLTPAEAWEAVSAGARKAMGLPPGRLEAGQPAEILAVRGADLADAVARASEHRIVVHAGRCVSRTQVTGALQPLPSTPVLT
jgi:cytosine deaminase